MIVKRCGEQLESRESKQFVVYLAGAMSPWRKDVIKALGKLDYIVVIDPTNYNYGNLNDQQLADHYQWEVETISDSDLTVYWLDGSSQCGMSLLEIGRDFEHFELLIGMTKDYPYYRDLRARLSNVLGEVEYPQTLNELVEKINDYYQVWCLEFKD